MEPRTEHSPLGNEGYCRCGSFVQDRDFDAHRVREAYHDGYAAGHERARTEAALPSDEWGHVNPVEPEEAKMRRRAALPVPALDALRLAAERMIRGVDGLWFDDTFPNALAALRAALGSQEEPR